MQLKIIMEFSWIIMDYLLKSSIEFSEFLDHQVPDYRKFTFIITDIKTDCTPLTIAWSLDFSVPGVTSHFSWEGESFSCENPPKITLN